MEASRTSDALPPTLPVAGVVILAGGVGTRLRSVIDGGQKVVAPVGGRPMLSYLLDQCRHAGAREVTLAVGYRAGQVRDELGAEQDGLRLSYSIEETAMGTGGAIALAASRMPDGPVLVLNGDSFIDVDLAAVVAWHRAHRARATIVLTEVAQGGRFGAVTLAGDGRVTGFSEKDERRTGPGLVNAGVYVMERDVLTAMSLEPHSVERDVLPKLVGEGLYGWHVPGRFIDIGIPETYAVAGEVLTADRPTGRRGYVMLDRDGTLIEERNYLSDPAQVVLLPGVVEGLGEMQEQGIGLVLATNQAGIGRGYYTMADYEAVQRRLTELLGAHGVRLQAAFACPHHPDAGCVCRKPATGMVDQARALFGGEAPFAVIGDKRCDVELGHAVGAAGILVTTGYGQEHFSAGVDPDFLVDDLRAAAHVVAELSRHAAMTEASA